MVLIFMSILSMNKFVLAQKYTLCYYGNVVKGGCSVTQRSGYFVLILVCSKQGLFL